MFCNKCGVELPDGSGFCNKCGASQGGAAAAPAHVADPAAAITNPQPAAPKKEEEVWKGGYSGRAMGMAFVGAGAWFVGLWIAYFVFSAKDMWFHDKDWFLWLIVALAPLPGIYAALVLCWRKLTLGYRLTSQRLFITHGFISRRVEEVELVRVDDVSTAQGIVERVFDVGSVLIVSSDATTPRVVLHGIRTPISVKEKIRGIVMDIRKKIVNIQNV